MSENPFLSYLNHLDAGYLFLLWKQGAPFTPQDWISVMLLVANLALVIALGYLLIKKQRRTTSRSSVNQNRSQERLATEHQARREPEISAWTDSISPRIGT